ncbi:hypothetical protein M8S10_18975 [Enterobacter chuandaensis]|uniref:RCC1 domain-containing protein n=1 Tax=Enterobacter chuandaensis TaxID=2497875 RepID=UPI0020759047|nr:hypothetical protein [Enterobacter chuandaensis]MCM7590885.1 hypothetical protein [Enterobacter chuandaensis]
MENSNESFDLKIMGARTRVGMGWANNERKLVALDKNTLEPVVVDWSYEDAPEEITTTHIFTDTKPTKRLLVNSELYVRGSLVNISNIGGAGAAFAAIQDNGNVVAWGLLSQGGVTPTSDRNHDVKVVYGSEDTSIGINNLKQIFVWGKTSDDPIPENIAALNDVSVVKAFTSWDTAPYRVFVALRENKQIVQWGDEGWPWSIPEHIAEMKDIVAIEATEGAFAAIKENGHVVAWGDPERGGQIPEHLNDISDARKIFGNDYCFVVLHESGKVSAWGNSQNGGEIPADISALSDIIKIYPYFGGFMALRANNTLVEWGWHGNSIPPEVASRSDFVDVQVGSSHIPIVLFPDGKVVSWGKVENPYYVQQPKDLSDVILICAAPESVAVIKKDGSVVAWGSTTEGGGDTTSVANELYNIRAIYPSTYGFCALRDDGKVIFWGRNKSDMSPLPPELQNNISYAWE